MRLARRSVFVATVVAWHIWLPSGPTAQPAAGGVPPVDAMRIHAINVRDGGFGPDTDRLKLGEKVIWINRGTRPHTVTASDKTFDSGPISPAASWSYSTVRRGVLRYTCALHPAETGAVVVE